MRGGTVGGEEGGVQQFTCEGEWTNEAIAITTTTSLPLYISHSPVSHLHTITSPSITITRSPGECRYHSNTTHTHCHQILLFRVFICHCQRKGGREGVREGGREREREGGREKERGLSGGGANMKYV